MFSVRMVSDELFLIHVGRVLFRYLSIFDDYFFSPKRDTEIAFEQKLKSLTSVDFMSEVSYFIGMKLSWQQKPDNHIAVHIT